MRGTVAKRLRRQAEEKTKGQPKGMLVARAYNKFTSLHRQDTTRNVYQNLKKRYKEAQHGSV